jgi:hypothetical protein
LDDECRGADPGNPQVHKLTSACPIPYPPPLQSSKSSRANCTFQGDEFGDVGRRGEMAAGAEIKSNRIKTAKKSRFHPDRRKVLPCRYRQFADGLAASLSQHLATPPEEGGQDDPSCSISGAGRPRVRVLLVVFTDSEEAHHELGGWNDAWGKGSNVAAGIGRGERGVERGRGGAGSYNDGNTFMRRVDHFVHHYGWPQLAMRRCVSTHENGKVSFFR